MIHAANSIHPALSDVAMWKINSAEVIVAEGLLVEGTGAPLPSALFVALGADRVTTGQPGSFQGHQSTERACALLDGGLLEEDGPPVKSVGESHHAEGPHLRCASVEPGLKSRFVALG